MFSRFRRNQNGTGPGDDADDASTPAAAALADTVAEPTPAAAPAPTPVSPSPEAAPVDPDNSFSTSPGGEGDDDDDELDEATKARDDLEAQVRARDAHISSLEKTRADKQAELAALQTELEEERLQQMKAAILHRIETERLERQTKAVEDRLTALERDMQDTDAITEYANLIKGVAPKGGVDSQYVMKLQSQLAKAVKKMDATAHQMAQVEQSCEDVVASLQSEIAEIVEDRCRTELELRKQLELLEEQKADMQAEYDDRIRDNQRELQRLKEKAAQAAATKAKPDQPSVADLERELEETEAKLEQLNNIHEMQERTIEELNQTMENGGSLDDPILTGSD